MRGSLVRCFTTAVAAAALALPAAAATQFTGAGSSFDYPFFSKAFYIYNQKNPDVTVNYQSIGSGGGIQQFTAKNVDFGATDVPMNAEELARAGGAAGVLQIPVALGGAAVAYNLPGVTGTLKLTRQAVADIYLGKILKWNDPQIASLNPGVKLPDMPIVVVHRSDGSGTSYIFTDFLSHVSPEWKSKVGTGKSVSWPAPSAVGAKGNEGVAGQIRSTPGAIGYVELAYVVENHMSAALLQNRAGKWAGLLGSDRGSSGGEQAGSEMQRTSRSSMRPVRTRIRSPGIHGSSIYKKPADAGRGKILYNVLAWLVGPQGQSYARSVDYVPLPVNVQNAASATLRQMQH